MWKEPKCKPKPAQERNIQTPALAFLRRNNVRVTKHGSGGYPDYLVLTGQGTHFWLEFKTKTGRFTKAQKIIIPKLIEMGDTVFIPRSLDDVRSIYDYYIRGEDAEAVKHLHCHSIPN